MNKHSIGEKKNTNNYKQVLKVMKITLFLLFCSIMFSQATTSYSQDFTFNIKSSSIKEVCKEIERNSDFIFVFSDNSEKLIDKKVNVIANSKNVSEILDVIFSDTNLTYEILDKQVVVYESKKTLPAEESKQTVFIDVQQPTKKQISGQVIDTEGEAIIGANIIEKGTTNGTVTDRNGNFSFMIENDAIVTISYIGYLTQEIDGTNQTFFNIVLQEDTEILDEVVVVGFGIQRKVNLTGAVSEVKGEELTRKTATGSIEALQGVLPGTTITRSSGSPGEEGYEIQIRGITSANNNPVLVLVDGIEGSLENVRPEDIESISVLKDAAAAAIYGSKAAGGVMLVTTKKGDVGKLKIELNSYYSLAKFARLPERLPTWQNAEMLNSAWINAGLNPQYSQEQIEKLKDPSIIYEIDPANPNQWVYYGDFDFREEALKDFGAIQSHNVAISGGNENTTFRLSGTYYENDGIIKIGYDSNQRYTGTANMENKFGKHLILSNVLSYSNNMIEKPGRGGGGLEGAWGFLEEVMIRMGRVPLKDPNGNWVGGEHKIYEWSSDAGLRKEDQNNLRINSALTLQDIVKGLQFRFVAAMDANFNNTFRYESPIYRYGVDESRTGTLFAGNSVYKGNNKSRYREFQFLTDYDLELNQHAFHFLGGYSASDFRAESFNAQASDKTNPNLHDFNWASNLGIQLGDNVATNALQSVFGRFTYNYDNRYLFEANVRYDGSSKLSPGNRYELFPSLSAGWRINEENWFNIPFISQFKLRGSWGQLGNEGVLGNYSYIGLLNVNDDIILNDEESRTRYTHQQSLASENITWETIETSNIGVDLGFFDNKLSITGDYFVKKNKNMLARVAYPSVIGVGLPLFNVGELKTWGWEANVSWRNQTRVIDYWINANIADAQNELIDYMGADVFAEGTVRLLNGYPLNSIFGYKTDGLFQSQEEVDAHAFQDNRTGPGDVKYLDLNNDGRINAGDQTKEDHGDLVYLGNTNPRYTFGIQGGFNWKNIDISLFFQGVGKRVATMDGPLFPLYFAARTYHKGHLDYWTEDNPDAFWPRLYRVGQHNFKTSERTLQNAAYIRLKDIQLGYSLPDGLLNHIGIQRIRFYVAGKDLWEFTKVLDYMDPEIPNQVTYQYPFSRRYTLGVNLNF